MTEKNKESTNSVQDKNVSSPRRDLMKVLAASGSAIVAGQSLPENWSKPITDSVLLPAHAQTSTMTIIGRVVMSGDDAGDIPNPITYDPGSYISSQADDDLEFALQATVFPPAAVTVSASVVAGGDLHSTAPLPVQTATSSAVDGIATFAPVTTDDLADNNDEMTVLFSASGYGSSGIFIDFA